MSQGGFIGGTAGLLSAAGFFAYAVRGRSASIFGPSVYRGDRARQSLALTFDDGPSESTTELLDLLAAHNIRATFFMCGQNVDRLPAVARRVAEAGHQIGNHSDTHPYFHLCSPGRMYQELATAQAKIQQATGAAPALFRAPYGVRWFGLAKAQHELNLLGVMWSTIGLDWKLPAAAVAQRILKNPGNGDIFCLHDGRGTQKDPDIRATIEALQVAIPEFQKRGFRFETVSEILRPALP
ncbi:MAG: polysaccharide deacetylase family protein [Bryobacteraceae bacterium]